MMRGGSKIFQIYFNEDTNMSYFKALGENTPILQFVCIISEYVVN